MIIKNKKGEIIFDGTNLMGANLRGADLSGANLRWSDLRGADLRGADLGWAGLIGAKYDGNTILPFDDDEAKKRGMIKYEI